MEYKTTEAQRRSSREYDKRNAAQKNYWNKRSITKNFITKTAEPEDIELVKEWLAERTGQPQLKPESITEYLDSLTEDELKELIREANSRILAIKMADQDEAKRKTEAMELDFKLDMTE